MKRKQNQPTEVMDPMIDMDDTEFENGDAGASLTYPQQCSALRKNGFVMLKDHPCKIVQMSTSKTGKHGHAKVHLVGTDLFTGKKYEDICPSSHNMRVPHIKKQDFEVVDTVAFSDFLSLMGEAGELRSDIRKPTEELQNDIEKAFTGGKVVYVTVLMAMGQEVVVATRNEQP